MKCPYCAVESVPASEAFRIGADGYDFNAPLPYRTPFLSLLAFNCPSASCRRMFAYLRCEAVDGPRAPVKELWRRLVHPRTESRPECHPTVPASIRESYDEAYAVLADSPKASAALSRRCLQEILQTAAQTRAHDLADAIDEVLASKTLPSHLALDIDQVRVVGNFAAHPIKSKTSGQIVSVEPHEAEFNLHVVHALLDFYYAAPAAAAARRAAITAKITAAGKTLKAPPP